MPLRLALYQPDIPQNTGTLLRLGACLDIPVDIIEPCGFVWSEKQMRRAGMDYLKDVQFTRHINWDAFVSKLEGRLILLTTKTDQSHIETAYQPGDTLLLGRESAGVPDEVHARADQRVTIPMAPDQRSLNVAVAGAMVLSEALRQTNGFPSSQ
ncbi:MAG: tRNA (cytidine(34)-2'-O)-methyltransferase [Magnetovibrionaceae bacterium]